MRMNNILVYIQTDANGQVALVSTELLTKAKSLANELQVKLEAVAIGKQLQQVKKVVAPFGVDMLHIFDDAKLYPYTTLPYSSILAKLIQEVQPQIVLMGATSLGRDLAPRVAASVQTGLTANCIDLQIDKQTGLLDQIRPAFGDNMMATIVTPQRSPQMATVRGGVFVSKVYDANYTCEEMVYDVAQWVTDADLVVKVLEEYQQTSNHSLPTAQVVVAGGYGVGSKENFALLYQLADVLNGEVGATRAATDAGWIEHDRMIGQTGVTVRPKLYIACGISGQVQHITGMQDSDVIVSINVDEQAPINQIADYVVVGKVHEVLPKLIQYLQNRKK